MHPQINNYILKVYIFNDLQIEVEAPVAIKIDVILTSTMEIVETLAVNIKTEKASDKQIFSTAVNLHEFVEKLIALIKKYTLNTAGIKPYPWFCFLRESDKQDLLLMFDIFGREEWLLNHTSGFSQSDDNNICSWKED